MRYTAALLACLALVLAAARCGGGGDRLSRSEFVSRANGICRTYQRKIAAVPRPAPSFESIVDYVERVLPLVRRGVAEERALRPPTAAEPAWKKVLASNDRVVATTRELTRAAQAHDVAAVRRASNRLKAEDRRTDALARRLGLTTCAST